MTLDDVISKLSTLGAIRADSREVQRGDVFVAVRGLRADGHAFVAKAAELGAAVAVVERAVDGVAIPQVVVPNGAAALGILVAAKLGDPAKAMTLVGITGTNGKTTTTYLVESILAAAGHKPGVIGTVSYRYAGIVEDAPYTTPTPHVLHETFAKMRAAGCTHVVMEVSSAALAMDRLAGVTFQVAAFSNLTQDHLDVHGSMDAYAAAKRRLFTDHLDPAGTAVVNVDDPAGESMAIGPRVVRATLRDATYESTIRGIAATIRTPRGSIAVEAPPLVGEYNVANVILAVNIGVALGIPDEAIARGIATLAGVPGRVERVANAAGLDILVDYAHTPDALRNVLATMRPLTKRRLICVFGCGGDRDPTKRPKMGAAVAELADLAIVTSDNPRTENPRAIIDQILPGVPKPFAVLVDRRAAIRAAVAEATPGDVIVIAGKGHEDYQIIGTTKHHFDDREEAAAACAERWSLSLADAARITGGSLAPASGDVRVSRVVIDSRAVAPGDLYVAIRGESHDGNAFNRAAIEAGAAAVLCEREPYGASIVVDDSRIALGKLAHAHRRSFAGSIVAVTGSAGKTTTKELVRAALSEVGPTLAAEGSLNNETGVPLTVLKLRPYHRFGVIEMGMRGLGQIEYLTNIVEPDVAVVVNAGVAHIELLGSTDAIAQAKSEIWLGLRAGGTIVRPMGDDRLERFAHRHRPDARHVTFGDAAGADVHLVERAETSEGMTLTIDAFGARFTVAMALIGHHVALDACAAIAAAHAAGAPLEAIVDGLARAKPPSMRGEVVRVADRRVIVDCYNANPASMAAALKMLAERGGRGLAVLGDMLELGDHAAGEHRLIGRQVAHAGLEAVVIGAHAADYIAGFTGTSAPVTSTMEAVATPADAAARALARTRPGDWILLKASRGMKLERVLEDMKKAT